MKRFGQHRAKYASITSFGFRPTKKTRLDVEERQAIEHAERIGLLLTNKALVTDVLGETDLDLLIAPSAQKRWVESGRAIRLDSGLPKIPEDDVRRMRYRKRYLGFEDHPMARTTTRLLSEYVKRCIPAPPLTAGSFWALNCMPATNRSTWPRLAAVNVNRMEALVLGHEKNIPDRFWGFVNVSLSVVEEKYPSERALRRVFVDVEADIARYTAAGQDQLRIRSTNMDTILSLLRDPLIARLHATLTCASCEKAACSTGATTVTILLMPS